MAKSLLVLSLALLAACGGDSATSPTSQSLAGTYTMRTVNGSPLPFVVQSGTTKITITADVMTVADGGTWSETGAFTLTVNGSSTSQVISDGGTFVRAGATVSFLNGNQTAYTGSFTGSGFTLTDQQALRYVFSR